MTSTTALVLAGGSLAGKFLGASPLLSCKPAEIPDGSGFALDHIRERLQALRGISTLMVVVDEDHPDRRPMRQGHQWHWLQISSQPNVLASLDAALKIITTDQVLIQPITTLPPQTLPEGCWIGLGDQSLPREDWSAISAVDCNQPQFHPKRLQANEKEPDSHPFTGLISAPTQRLRQVLHDRFQQPGWCEAADQDLLSLAEALWKQGNTCLELLPWMDLGHRATASRRRLSRLTSRGFNSVSYCASGDLIHKCSQDSTRLGQEAAFIEELPVALRRFFPAFINHQPGHLELEYIPFPSLSELFLHWQIGANGWRQLMFRLRGVRDSLAHEQVIIPQPEVTVDWLYSLKLHNRLQQLSKQPPALESTSQWSEWWNTPWMLELDTLSRAPSVTLQLPAPSFAAAQLLDHLPSLENSTRLQRIHGDLCFNNILAEPLSGSIRLIDPRGERPDGANWPIGYGDPRYDLVKLLHSSRYLYDVVVNDLFELTMKAPGHLQLLIDVPSHYSEVNRSVEQMLIADQLSQEEERVLTASLFFSMLPLHREDGERCLVFAAIGLLILSRQFDAVLMAGGQAPIER